MSLAGHTEAHDPAQTWTAAAPCCAQEMSLGLRVRVLHDCENYVLDVWGRRKRCAILNRKGVQHGRAAAVSSGTKLHGAGPPASKPIATTKLCCAPLAFEAGTAGCCRGNRLPLFPSKELEKTTAEPTRNVSSDHECTHFICLAVLRLCARGATRG